MKRSGLLNHLEHIFQQLDLYGMRPWSVQEQGHEQQAWGGNGEFLNCSNQDWFTSLHFPTYKYKEAVNKALRMVERLSRGCNFCRGSYYGNFHLEDVFRPRSGRSVALIAFFKRCASTGIFTETRPRKTAKKTS